MSVSYDEDVFYQIIMLYQILSFVMYDESYVKFDCDYYIQNLYILGFFSFCARLYIRFHLVVYSQRFAAITLIR